MTISKSVIIILYKVVIGPAWSGIAKGGGMWKWLVWLVGLCGVLYLGSPGFSQEDAPDWLKRVELSTQLESDKQPIFYFQTVQPLYQGEGRADTVFVQPRVSLKGGDLTYNLGLGYRRLQGEDFLWGINIFGDYADLHEHGRVGVGLEALGQVLEARLNSYFGITPKRIVEESSSATIYERIADGLDLELGSVVPYLPWLKIYGAGFWYDFDKAKDKYGWKTRLEARVNNSLRVEFYLWDDNKGEPEYGSRLRFNIAFDTWSDLSRALRFAERPFPAKDLRKETLVPVERNFDIVVEKWSESSSLTVEIKRGN